MEITKEIDDIIEKALVDKTFSLEVIEKIKELKERVIELDSVKEENKNLKKSLTTAETEIGYKEGALENWNKREEELKTREAKVTESETKAASAETRLSDYKEMFGIVFRNPVLKETVFKSSQVQRESGGYPIQVPESESINTETVSE